MKKFLFIILSILIFATSSFGKSVKIDAFQSGQFPYASGGEKTSLVGEDRVLIEDSENGNQKVYSSLSDILTFMSTSNSYTINQAQDDVAITINGYDDHSDKQVVMGIDSDGVFRTKALSWVLSNPSDASKFLRLNMTSDGSAGSLMTNGVGTTFAITTDGYLKNSSSSSYVWFQTGADQSLYFDAGGYISFRDRDSSNATRVQINSSNGDITTIGNIGVGSLSVPSAKLNVGGATGTSVGVNLFSDISAGSNPKLRIYGWATYIGDVAKYCDMSLDPYALLKFEGARGVQFSNQLLNVGGTYQDGAYFTLDGSKYLMLGTNATGTVRHPVFAHDQRVNQTPTFVFSSVNGLTTNFNFADTDIPEIYLHDGSTTPTNALVLKHNGTDGVIETKAGDIVLNPATGYVGVGATTPTNPLHVYKNSVSTTPLFLMEQAGTGDAGFEFKITGTRAWSLGIDNSDNDTFKISKVSDGFASTPELSIDTSGRVGIGTSSPTSGAKLDVIGSIFMLGLRIDSGTTGGMIVDTSGSRNYWAPYIGTGYDFSKEFGFDATTGNEYWYTESETNLAINVGNVGIGSNSPSEKLFVYNGAIGMQNSVFATFPTNKVYSMIYSTHGGGSYPFDNYQNLVLQPRVDTARDIILANGNPTPSPRLVVKADGKIGIGTTTPDTLLDVNGAITSRELSADPANPDEGAHVVWQSDGTGSGDDGDIMVKITAGGVTKTTTLIDFSAL